MRLEFISVDEHGYITLTRFERESLKECLVDFICDRYAYEYAYEAGKVYEYFNVEDQEDLEDYLYTHSEEELLNFLKEDDYKEYNYKGDEYTDKLRCIRNLDTFHIIFEDRIYNYESKRLK